MDYEVLVTRRAQQDLEETRNYIAKYAPETAERWYRDFLEALCTLEVNPQAHPLAAENKDLPMEVRQYLYRTRSGRVNRALFTIVDREVRVLAIRRPGQQSATMDDLR
jgi:plasmid stabilization system protein ParE